MNGRGTQFYSCHKILFSREKCTTVDDVGAKTNIIAAKNKILFSFHSMKILSKEVNFGLFWQFQIKDKVFLFPQLNLFHAQFFLPPFMLYVCLQGRAWSLLLLPTLRIPTKPQLLTHWLLEGGVYGRMLILLLKELKCQQGKTIFFFGDLVVLFW